MEPQLDLRSDFRPTAFELHLAHYLIWLHDGLRWF
jgi:hypothetical protein